MPQGQPDRDDAPPCSECGRRPLADEDVETWRYRSDGVGELHPFCPACDEREFGGS